MTVSSPNVLTPARPAENLLSLNVAFQHSYEQARKQWQDGMTVIKDEFLDICDKAGSYLQKMVLPVNNFLKDLAQIDEEFRNAAIGGTEQPFSTNPGAVLIMIEQEGFWEENY